MHKILAVDDEPSVLSLLASVITLAGFQALAASSAKEALVIFAKPDPPAALVTDIRMPGMDGFDLAREVRRRSPGFPVLFVSGYAGELAAIPEDLREETTRFIPKPFSLNQIAALLRELLPLGR